MMHKATRLLSVISLLLLMTACSTISSWFEDDEVELAMSELVEFSNEFEPVKVWSTDTGDGSKSEYSNIAVWLQNGKLFVVDYEGDVAAYDPATGQRIWAKDLDVAVNTGVGGGDELVLVGTAKGKIFAMDETNGKLLWQQQLTSEVLAPPKALNNVVVARTADGKMRGLSAIDGNVLWTYQRKVPLLSLRGASAAVLIEDKVIAGFANGKLVALSLNDGQLIWEKSVAVSRGRSELARIVDIDSDPVVMNGTVFAVTYQGQVAAFDIESGRRIWSREMSSRAGLDVAPDESVYVSDESDYVWALQDYTGDALWRQTRLLRRKISAPAVFGSNVIVGDVEGYVHWISREDGRFVARSQVSKSPIRSKAVVDGDVAYVLAEDGELAAFRLQ